MVVYCQVFWVLVFVCVALIVLLYYIAVFCVYEFCFDMTLLLASVILLLFVDFVCLLFWCLCYTDLGLDIIRVLLGMWFIVFELIIFC